MFSPGKKTPLTNIIISRTDSIGDVVLTLPVAAVLKEHFPRIKIGFLGKEYTRAVINNCKYVDEFIELNDFMTRKITVCGQVPEAILHVLPVSKIATRARQLQIPLRIGTTNRLYHWFTCNRLVKLSRKNSDLHEAQLNIKLLRALGIDKEYSLKSIEKLYGFELIQPLQAQFIQMIEKDKFNVILHPKSQGNGREWPLENYIQLIKSLNVNHYKIFISGTEKERNALQPLLKQTNGLVTDITGLMNLPQFIAFINACDGFVASGTGPLHIAAALGKNALGIFPPIRPVHPGRWAAVGVNAQTFVMDKFCDDCRKNSKACLCMAEVQPVWIKTTLDKLALVKQH